MSESPKYDLVIVGAGPVGCTIAERAATQKGWRSLILEKRDHIAGNCYDSKFKNGVMIHNYGPHFFRTDNTRVIEYLSRFTDWLDGNYIVKSMVDNRLYPFPVNLDTLEMFFNTRPLDPESAENLLKSKALPIENPKNSEEFVLSRLGRELYEAFYLGYTLKQWNKHPRDLDPSVCGRIPVKFNRDPYYVNQHFRKIPRDGYTAMFSRMIDHPLIELRLNADYFDLKDGLNPQHGTIYSGPIDRFFDFKFGKLEWRSLEFDFQARDKEFIQDCAVVNYPNDHKYTRTVEIKHVTRQSHPQTVICKEYPKDEGDPYYPVPSEENMKRYLKYKELADSETDVYFAGRLAEYTYINTDEAVLRALTLLESL